MEENLESVKNLYKKKLGYYLKIKKKKKELIKFFKRIQIIP